MRCNFFSVSTGHFNLADFSDEDTQVWFTLRDDAPFERRRQQFIHRLDYAPPEAYTGLSVLEAARLCQECIDRYWINSDKEKIAALVAYLETTERDDQIAALTDELTLLDERRADVLEQLAQWQEAAQS